MRLELPPAAAPGRAFALGLALLLAPAAARPDPGWQARAAEPELLHRGMKALADAVVHDIFSPPVASRVFVYSAIAAHEAMAQEPGGPASFAGRLRELAPALPPPAGGTYCFPLVALTAFSDVARALVFSEERIAAFRDSALADYRAAGVPADVFRDSVAHGEAIAKHVLAWAGGDGYKPSRSYPRYTPLREPGKWSPTPPDYMDAVEPHWAKIRALLLDSPDQFRPPPPPAFATGRESDFYRQALEVYEVGRNLDPGRETIARFWDCNPFATQHQGHLMLSSKRTSPGGHWMGVAAIACRQTRASFGESARLYAVTAIALFDGFISCWDEKYRSQLIRPESYINRHIDASWRPLLQTPPFPEYPSGHSVISAAAASVLEALLGPSFSYLDTVEVEFGQPERRFASLREAADEAAISRLYGGIHFRAAIENGVDQGKKVGRHVVERLELGGGAAHGKAPIGSPAP